MKLIQIFISAEKKNLNKITLKKPAQPRPENRLLSSKIVFPKKWKKEKHFHQTPYMMQKQRQFENNIPTKMWSEMWSTLPNIYFNHIDSKKNSYFPHFVVSCIQETL